MTEREILTEYLVNRILVSDDYNFQFYLRECIEDLPWEDLKVIAYERNLHFVVTAKNTVVSMKPILYDHGKGEMVLVVFAVSFAKLRTHEIRYVIAHELAHVFLGHYDRANWNGEESERDADRQVMTWGLEREVRQTPFSYLGHNRS